MSADTPSPKKILVVEDEAVIAMEIESRLGKMGYEVVGVAATGEKALSLAAATHPDLALMDIHLVGPLDGVATAEQLRASFDIPIVFLTAYGDDATIRRATATGPLGYLTKPFSDRDVHAAIEVALYKHTAEREMKRYREELEKMVLELGTALNEVKTLKALLPVCAGCKKVRDDDGYWSAVDEYITKQGLAKITHSMCPDCIRKYYPELAEHIITTLTDLGKPTDSPAEKSSPDVGQPQS